VLLCIQQPSARLLRSPSAPLIADAVGNLYGTTYDWALIKTVASLELSPSDNGWQYTLLSSFSGPDGAYPASGLVFDKLGNLYGATGGGGNLRRRCGIRIKPLAGGGWGETVLYSFGNGDDGYDPRSKTDLLTMPAISTAPPEFGRSRQNWHGL